MSTTIDSLQIEIQSSSNNAAGGIDKLAEALGRLKKVGSFNVVVKNLNNLSSALDKLQNSSSGLSKLNSLASSIESLKKAGSFGSISTSFAKLGTALKDLESMNIDGVVAKIKELNDKVGPVSQKLVNIGNAFKAVNSKVSTASGGFSIFGGKVNTTTLNLSSMINVLRGVKSALAPIVNLLKNAIGEAIEWDGIAQRFGRGFGEQAEEVYSWVQRLNKEMGINTQQFMQYSSTYATMLKGFGVGSKDASEMALGYMELTYDVWSGYNDIYKSLEDAATAVRSAIAGEVEPVRKAGFTIIESTLEQTAANHGLKISLENATEAQKSYLRYLTMVDQAKAQGLVGNYAKEMNTAEGAVRTFTQQLKSLAQTFGSVFLPILLKIMPVLNEFVRLVGDAIIAIATLFGVDIQKVDFSNSLGVLGDSADSAKGAVKDTTKALKDLKNATTGIDELNIISPQTKSGGSGAGGSGFSSAEVGSLWDEGIFDDIDNQVSPVTKAIAVLAGFAVAISTVAKAWKLMKPVVAGLKEYVAAVKVMAPEVGLLNAMFPKLSSSLAVFSGKVSAAWGAVSTFLAGISAPVWVAIAAAIVALIGVIVFLRENWDKVTAAVSRFFKENIAPKLENIKESFRKMGEALGPVGDAIAKACEWLKNFMAEINILDGLKTVFEAIGFVVVEVFGGVIAGAFQAVMVVIDGFVQSFSGIVQIVSGVVSAIVRLFKGDFRGAWDACKEIWQGIVDLFVGAYKVIVAPLEEFVDGVISWFVDLWDELVGHSIVPDTIDGIVKCFVGLPGKVLGVVANFVKNVIGNFSDFGSKIVSKISAGWNVVKDWWNKNASLKAISAKVDDFKGKVSSAWNSAKSWWNSKPVLAKYVPTIGSIKDILVSAWNTAKTWWNKNVKLSIPSLSFKVTYSSAGLNAVQKSIVKVLGLQGWPKLSFAANGGIFDTGSLVWAGESGPEVLANAGGGKTGVMNVQQMSEAVYEGVYSAVMAAMRAGGGNGGGQAVNVYLDGKQITASVEQRQKERGASLMGSQVYSY